MGPLRAEAPPWNLSRALRDPDAAFSLRDGGGAGGRRGVWLLTSLLWALQYPPPMIPPRGEVNAADAFDIGSFDEEDTKGIKVLAGRWPPWCRREGGGGRSHQKPDAAVLSVSAPSGCRLPRASCTWAGRGSPGLK